MSRTSRLLHYLQSGKAVTGKIAMNRFGLYRLSEYIRRFRKNKNLNIVTEMKTRNGVSYASYSLNSKQKS